MTAPYFPPYVGSSVADVLAAQQQPQPGYAHNLGMMGQQLGDFGHEALAQVLAILGGLHGPANLANPLIGMIGPGAHGPIPEHLKPGFKGWPALPNEGTEQYLARTAKEIYSPVNQEHEAMLRMAEDVVNGKAHPAVRSDDGQVFTRKEPAEHGDLAPWAEQNYGAEFKKPGWSWRGWLMNGKFVSAEDLGPYLAQGF